MSKATTFKRRSTGRFAQRAKRIARRDERNRFSSIATPVIWLSGSLGVAALCAVTLHFAVTGTAERSLWGVAALPLLVAALLAFFRLVRGHFNADLDEP